MIDQERHIVFAHGWAFGDSFWEPLVQSLKLSPSVSNRFLSRPYFESDQGHGGWNGTQLEVPWIGVGHSFGFRRLTQLGLQNCLGLISINGFWDFSHPHGASPRVVRRMLKVFDRDPEKVLKEFHRNCGIDHSRIDSGLALENLRVDLESLLIENLSEPFPVARLNSVPIAGLAGGRDQIIPLAQAQAQFENLHIHPQAEHSLGLDYADWCATRIHELWKAWTT